MKNVIFDLDGTLCDTIADLNTATNEILSRHHYETITLEEQNRRMGNGIGYVFRLSVGDDETLIKQMVSEFKLFYIECCTEKTIAYPGVLECLKQLKKDGYKLAVVTNKINEAAIKVIDHCFAGLFDVVVGEQVQLARKPDPAQCLYACELMKVNLADSIYIGDSEVDVKTALNAKIPCVLVSWGSRSKEQLQEAGAEVIVDRAEDLLKEIRKCH